MLPIELWRRGVKQHFKGLSDNLEKCQFTTHGVLCPNRSCHYCTSFLIVTKLIKRLKLLAIIDCLGGIGIAEWKREFSRVHSHVLRP